MAMMTDDRPVVISVTGGNSTSHQANYTVKVPYSSMARTIQVITKQGGKITNVAVPTINSSVAPSDIPVIASSVAPIAVPSEAPIAPVIATKSTKESSRGFKPKKK